MELSTNTYYNSMESYTQNATVAWVIGNELTLVENSTEATVASIRSSSEIPNWCGELNLFVYLFFLGIICIFGVSGNSMTQYVMWSQAKINPTSFLIVTLAALDNISLILHFIGKWIPTLCSYFKTCMWWLNYVAPVMNGAGWYPAHIAQVCGAWNIVMLSFIRYIAICKPLDTEKYTPMKKIKIIFAVMVISCTVFYSPRLFRREISFNDNRTKLIYRTADYAKTTAYFIYEVPIYYLVMFLIPFTLLIIMTYCQIKALKKTRKRREQMSRSKREEMAINKTLIVVVIVFMICNTWEPIRRLIDELTDSKLNDCGGALYYGTSLKVVFSCFNSAVNIIIYSVFNKRFRKDFMKKIFRRYRVHPDESTHVRTTNANTQSSI